MKTEKRKIKILPLFLLALLLSSGFLFAFKIPVVKAAIINIVNNGSFESGTTGWSLISGTMPETTTYTAYDGSYSLRQKYYSGMMRPYTLSQSVPNIDSDMVTECYVWMRLYANANVGFLRVTYSDASYSETSSWLTSSWVKYSLTVTPGKVITNIRVGVLYDSSYVNMDDRSYVDLVTLNVAQAYVSADLEPDATGPDWVFTDWRYYTFTVEIPSAMYSGNLDFVYIGFTEILTSNGTVGFSAWSDGSGWDSSTNMLYETRDLEPIRVKAGSWSNNSAGTVLTFPLWFTKSCLDIWMENKAVDALLWFNDTTGASSGWINAAPNLFRVYTDGGFSRVYSGYGDSGALPGGRDFSMYAYNDSYVFKDLYWRDLQHIKMVPEIQFRAGYQYFQLNYGIDYILKDGSYQAGLHLQFEPDAVSYTGVFASNVWINYTVSWYDDNNLVKSADLYSFYHGEVYKAGDFGRVKFFIDFWFDSGNASSLIGGRINAYEFPMKDNSAVWLRWLSSAWGVKDDVLKQDECIVSIHNTADETINSENIEFVRVWSALSVPGAEYNQYVAILGFDSFDTTLSPEPTLKGISTPPWDETQMPVMRNTGVLGAIWSMFAGIGKWLADNILFGGLALWPAFVAFLDNIAGWLGAPNGFSNFLTWLGNGWIWLVDSFTYALTLVYNIFLFLGSIMYSIVTTLGEAIVSFANMIGMIGGFLSGTIGGAGDLWNTLGISTWITIAIIFYPLYLIILWDQKGMDAVIKQLTMIVGIITWLKDFFIGLINLVMALIGRIIESIPVVE